ncbi:RNA-binding cell elongation regulator Jag/EloR [Hazenella coriacea]|uniref:RNA-binding protein KhpB n=1 Tax=Hazenella coriacea TaxID=1179467 RepID=A0A4R3L8T5_9BACL|nr:RNA-binding cell elongation regulator Jag/EloR [Hazenella coriacea]TCS95485.1 spoIIIJ-associated protein [Hazenella coriacea]
MIKVVVEAKTVDEAVKLACQQLHTDQSKVNIHILEYPKKGFLGLFARKAKVEVERIIDPVDEALHFLTQVTKKMGFDVLIDVERLANSASVTFHIRGSDLGLLIGKRGQTLESLQLLTNIVANRSAKKSIRFLLDADGYRKRREEVLIALAKKLAKQVLHNKKNVVLDPMPPNERKIIHHVIQKDKNLTTYSEGIEPHRYVVISWKA